MTPAWKTLGIGLLWSGAVLVACSASAPSDDRSSSQPTSGAGSSDGGTALNIPTGTDDEICGNGVDDDGDDAIDENCGCGSTTSTNEFSGPGDCPTQPDAATGCTPTSQSETSCADGQDDDCDGAVDCADPDCRAPGQCGCNPTEQACADGQDDDCDGVADCGDEDCSGCVPGSTRYCDEPVYCAWGQQTCGPDGHWGACKEVPPPAGCEGFFGFDSFYDPDCCVAKGFCCQAYPADDSIGNCTGAVLCP